MREPFPAGFGTQRIATNGTTLYTRIGGKGPAVVLLHGYGETGDMWASLAARLAATYTVIVPGLRGMGLSARPSGGYDRKTRQSDTGDGSALACAVPAHAHPASCAGFLTTYRTKPLCGVYLS